MKSEQRIITIGREFGSGGHKVAESLGRLMGIPVLDKNILVSVAKEAGADADLLEKYDETPRRYFISRTVNGFSNAPEINVAQMQFDYLRKKAEAGESFIIIGRCGDAGIDYGRSGPSACLSAYVGLRAHFRRRLLHRARPCSSAGCHPSNRNSYFFIGRCFLRICCPEKNSGGF